MIICWAVSEECEQFMSTAALTTSSDVAVNPANSENGGQPVQDEESYVEWCQREATRLTGEAEYGQACAWYTHAINAAHSESGETGVSPAMLAGRADAFLQLGRFTDALKDCERALALSPSFGRAQLHGAVALLHLGANDRLDSTRFARHVSTHSGSPAPPFRSDGRGGVLRSLSSAHGLHRSHNHTRTTA